MGPDDVQETRDNRVVLILGKAIKLEVLFGVSG